ncbi:LLM class flavin-dependent oxidoreductase [Alkalibacillus almallahensis]|uniref:LLM class flavin-dependent oxidoreductase n=1 Tax=Alkalibacillus almallahensis TaxID=1379154 RepID=UPI00141FE391|nr:LLM class flavin-dependent oxidoreductase [Alkalibacillus almallahensis]NIK11958.1 luciferase family oxidoreductase group 1 [Alkalibacillus almallahensis]
MLKLSVLDQSPLLHNHTSQEALQQTLTLAQHADELGYTRFWMSEHHSTTSLAGSAPEMLVPTVAAHTKRIRVGTGGVLLPHYSPFKVAEQFRVLEAMYPNRIDLGIGRAPGGQPGVNYALNRGQYPDTKNYSTDAGHLIDYLLGHDPQGYQVKATPMSPTTPPVWMLGSSGSSAQVAGELGTSYNFAQFINPEDGRDAVERYYDHFIPSPLQEEPYASIAVFVVVGDTDEEAEYYASSLDTALLMADQGQRRDHFPNPEEASQMTFNHFEQKRIVENRGRMILGNVESVKQQLIDLASHYQVSEVMINSIVAPFEQRLAAYEKIAHAFHLS